MILHYFPLFIFSSVFMSVKNEFVCVSQREDNKKYKDPIFELFVS